VLSVYQLKPVSGYHVSGRGGSVTFNQIDNCCRDKSDAVLTVFKNIIQ
jgi:hypothetical protein